MVQEEENETERVTKRDHSPDDRTEASGSKRAREVVEYEEVCL